MVIPRSSSSPECALLTSLSAASDSLRLTVLLPEGLELRSSSAAKDCLLLTDLPACRLFASFSAASDWRLLTARLPPSGDVSLTRRKASLQASSVCWLKGSRLLRIVPVKSVGSCATIVRLDRKSRMPSLEMSMPSISMLPESNSTKRKKARALRGRVKRQFRPHSSPLALNSHRVDFPLPVRPQTPTFSPGLMSKLTLCSTGGSSGA